MFKVEKKEKNSLARIGFLETAHGVVETPAYVMVGTHAQVRTLAPEDLVQTKTQLVIVNTYHMWRKLGNRLPTFSGLHAEMGWNGPLMTDSGGFQVFSFGFGREHGTGKIAKGESGPVNPAKLARGGVKSNANLVTVTEDGVYFRDGGEELYLDAEKSIAIQQQLGADIILAFDEPSSPRHDYDYTKEAMERTHRWAERSMRAKTSDQKLYGIVQGGLFQELREESARIIGAMDFDGVALGGAFGSSFGHTTAAAYQELEWMVPLLPELKPRHLLGIGRVEDIFEGVKRGIDTFDCVIPTREGRHGSIWTKKGRIDIKRGKFLENSEVLEPGCLCAACTEREISKSELYRLFKEKDPRAGYFATVHNVYFFNNLMKEIRDAIRNNSLGLLERQYIHDMSAPMQ